MTIFKLENNGTAKDILVNGQLVAKATEAGLQAVKPIKGPVSAADDDYVRQDQVFGVGQTLQDVTASRSFATTYTNSTSKPIDVRVTATLLATSGDPVDLFMQTGSGEFLSRFRYAVPVGGISVCTVSAVIMPGGTYRLTVVNGTVDAYYWMETRL